MHGSVSGLASVSSVCLAVPVPIPHGLNHCSFLVIPDVGEACAYLVLRPEKRLGWLQASAALCVSESACAGEDSRALEARDELSSAGLHLRCCARSASSTHSCHPPWLAWELPRKHFRIYLQRKAPGTCLSPSPRCLELLRFPPCGSVSLSYQGPFRRLLASLPICQGHNSGQTGCVFH